MENLTNILQNLYTNGKTLKYIYDTVIMCRGSSQWPYIFLEFIKRNRWDDVFMNEFNSTSFI